MTSGSYPAMRLQGRRIDESRIAAFETKIGHRLPDDYRAFLLEVNGGRPVRTLLALTGRHGTPLQILYGFDAPDDRDYMDLEGALEGMQTRERGKFPSEALPIGYDDFGNEFVLAIAGKRAGEVFFMALDVYPDRRHDTDWFQTRQFQRIAGSFTEFLAGLRPAEP